MNSLATMLHLVGPALLGVGALAAALALCAAVLFRRRKPIETIQRFRAEDLQMADFRAHPLLTSQEADWFGLLHAVAEVADVQCTVLPHVPLDRAVSAMTPLPPGAHERLRDTRVDFLVMDQQSQPIMAACCARSGLDPTMHRGLAHEIMEKAGIPVLDILPDDADEDVAADALALLLSLDVAVTTPGATANGGAAVSR